MKLVEKNETLDAVSTFTNFYIQQWPGFPDHTQNLDYPCILLLLFFIKSRDSVVGIATAYGLDDGRVEFKSW
jgi:hypothetical protein